MPSVKAEVEAFWNAASCGENLYLTDADRAGYDLHAKARYRLEPYILEFMEPQRWAGKQVLEIGVGMGADHQVLAEAGAIMSGVDLTERAIEHTARRFALLGLQSDLRAGDAENLPFADMSFDAVYSYGVIHHSPDTKRAAAEIMRVLRPGGVFKVMIYNRYSLVGFMLWLRYGLHRGLGLDEVYAEHMESPGTKAYTPVEAAALFPGTNAKTRIILTHGDLLTSEAGQRHTGVLLKVARMVWPRWLLTRVAGRLGTHLLIEGRKPDVAATPNN